LFIRNNARESPPTAAAVTPGRQKSFVNTNPNFHHYWEAPGGTNSLIPNLNKWPTNQLPVRQAISAAINHSGIISAKSPTARSAAVCQSTS
jgi:ABC-type transport system substrate-binding protein